MMQTLALVVLAVMLVGLIPVFIIRMLTFDQLVKLQHARFKTEWDKAGRPRGFFWRPPRGSGRARVWLDLKWNFATPEWMRTDEQAVMLLKRRRICFFVWNVGMLVIFLALGGLVLLNSGISWR